MVNLAEGHSGIFMQISLSLSVALFVLCGTCQSQSKLTYVAKIQRLRPATVEVLVSGQRHGTGFCVSSNGQIVTATHVVGTTAVTPAGIVVNYAPDLSVRFSDGRVVDAKPVDNSSPEAAFHDITLLQTGIKTPNFLRIGNPKTVREGEDIYLMGFPFDTPAIVTYRGNVSARFPIPVGTLNGNPVQSDTIHVQAPVAKGFSGAALLRMSDDTVIGVITNKLGGITPQLDEVRRTIQSTESQGRILMMGVDPNRTSLELINVLDTYLSAGAGWAVSINYIKPLIVQSPESTGKQAN